MTTTTRANDAATFASIIRHYLKIGRITTADEYLERYYNCYGPTRGYRHLYNEVTTALHNASKEVK